MNAFYVITKNEIGMNISTCRAVMLHFRSKSDDLPAKGGGAEWEGPREEGPRVELLY